MKIASPFKSSFELHKLIFKSKIHISFHFKEIGTKKQLQGEKAIRLLKTNLEKGVENF